MFLPEGRNLVLDPVPVGIRQDVDSTIIPGGVEAAIRPVFDMVDIGQSDGQSLDSETRNQRFNSRFRALNLCPQADEK